MMKPFPYKSCYSISSLVILLSATFSWCAETAGLASEPITFRAGLSIRETDRVVLTKFIEHAVEFADNLDPAKVGEKCRKSPEMFAWIEFPYLNCLNTAYALTGDTQYLERIKETFPMFRELMRTGTDAYLGWYGSPLESRTPKDNPDVQIDELQMNFRAISLLARWIELARQDSDYAARNKDSIDAYLCLMEQHLFPKWDERGHFTEIEGRGGVYRGLDFPLKGQPTLSFEKLSMMVDACLKLYRVSGKDQYLRRALQVGAWFKSCLLLKDGHYEWMSWMPAGAWDISPDKEDSWIPGWMAPDPRADWYIASLSIALNLYEHGLLFDQTDLDRFILTQKTMCWNGDLENPQYRTVAGQSNEHVRGRYLSHQLANYDPLLTKLAFHGPHEAEVLENSDNGWKGGVQARNYIVAKYLRHMNGTFAPQPFHHFGQAFLEKAENRQFLDGMDKPVPESGREAPRKPSDLWPDGLPEDRSY